MTRKLTKEEFVIKARNKHGDNFDYTYVNYINNHTNIDILCNKCGKIFSQAPSNHLAGKGCKYCCGHNTMTNEEFIAKAIEIHKDKYDYNSVNVKYNKEDVIIFCKKCQKYFSQSPTVHLRGCGCPDCGDKVIGDKLRSSIDEFSQKLEKKYPGLYDLSNSIYKNSQTPFNVKCNTCGNYFDVIPNNLLRRGGCSFCEESHLERDVRLMLDSHNVKYKRQQGYQWLGLQRLDFYLPNSNIAIECQGEQHFTSVKYFGGEKKLTIALNRDQTKYQRCKDNGIKLIYISSRKFKINYQDEIYGGIYTDDNLLFIEGIQKDNNILIEKIKSFTK